MFGCCLLLDVRKPALLIVNCSHPLMLQKIEICHFDGPVFQYMLRAPCQYTSFYLACNSRAGEVESVSSSTLRSLLISTLDWSNVQTFRHWNPYLDPVFNRTIPESSAPRLKQKKVRRVCKELALFELFLRENSRNSRIGK